MQIPRNTTVKRSGGMTTCLLTRDQLKAQLRVRHSVEDDLIDQIGLAAQEYVENATGRATMYGEAEIYFDGFPDGSRGWSGGGRESVCLMRSPIEEVTEVAYLVDGAYEVWIASKWRAALSLDPPELIPKGSEVWPSIVPEPAAVKISVKMGYQTAAEAPPGILQAIRLMAGHLYENREAVVSGTIVAEVPNTIGSFIRQQKAVWIL